MSDTALRRNGHAGLATRPRIVTAADTEGVASSILARAATKLVNALRINDKVRTL